MAGLDATDPIWRAYAPLEAALGDPALGEWLAGAPVIRAADALVAVMRPDGRFRIEEIADDPLDLFGAAGAADEVQRERAWLVLDACAQWAVLESPDENVRPGPAAAFWSTPDTTTRTFLRGAVAIAAMGASIRTLPGRSYRGEQVSVALAAAVTAAVSSDPWRLDDVSRRCDDPFALVIAAEVRQRLVELQVLGLLSAGEVLTAPQGGRAVVESVALGLAETPVPAPRHPDTRVKGPTYEVEAAVDVGGERRTRVVLVSGRSRVHVMTDVLMTAFGLRDETRTSHVLGLQLAPLLGTPGLLTRAGADRADPWTIGVGDVDDVDPPSDHPVAVVTADVSVQSLVEHLGEHWELPVDLWGVDSDDDEAEEEVLLQLRVKRTRTAQDSTDLVFPACVGGDGPHLSVLPDEATGVVQVDLDLEALNEVVARIHRGVRRADRVDA